MRPRVHDLFGQIPVYRCDIDAWLRAVPRLEPGSRRALYYVTAWRVVEKIKAAKLRGDFEDTITAGRVAPSPFWWARFQW